MRVDGGTSTLPRVPLGAEVLVDDRYGATLPAEVSAVTGHQVRYQFADGRQHRGQLDDIDRVLRIRRRHPATPPPSRPGMPALPKGAAP